MANRLNSRAIAAKLSWQIIDKGQSLDAAINEHFKDQQGQDRAFAQELIYGVSRWYGELDATASTLLNKPIRNKDRVVHFVILVGLYQLQHLNTPAHAAVSETVAACKQLNKNWARNLVNGCLRGWQREQDRGAHEFNAKITHPDWLVEKIEQSWPDYASTIFEANNQRPPMILRVNRRVNSRAQYLQRLNEADITAQAIEDCDDAIHLPQAVGVTQLPGFNDGAVSVQDTAAQYAAHILDPKPDQTILDACAAPGGKAAHLLEYCDNQLHLDALDISELRVERMAQTFSRLKLDANVYVADARDTSSWPIPSSLYDAIVIDAPCSGTGVIRRHPDIKHHRRPSDIDALCAMQQEILRALWPQVKNGGALLYMTCSILPQENEQQIEQFVADHADAVIQNIDHPSALNLSHGRQTLPGVHNMDGFYYSLMLKMGT